MQNNVLVQGKVTQFDLINYNIRLIIFYCIYTSRIHRNIIQDTKGLGQKLKQHNQAPSAPLNTQDWRILNLEKFRYGRQNNEGQFINLKQGRWVT